MALAALAIMEGCGRLPCGFRASMLWGAASMLAAFLVVKDVDGLAATAFDLQVAAADGQQFAARLAAQVHSLSCD